MKFNASKLNQGLSEFEEDHAWVAQNQDHLIQSYANRWIGVKNGQVIANDADLNGLLSKLADPAHTVVEFVAPTRTEIVL